MQMWGYITRFPPWGYFFSVWKLPASQGERGVADYRSSLARLDMAVVS